MIRSIAATRSGLLSQNLTDLCAYLTAVLDDPDRRPQHVSAALLRECIRDTTARAHMLETDLAVAQAAAEADRVLIASMLAMIGCLTAGIAARDATIAALSSEIEEEASIQASIEMPFKGWLQ